MLKTKTTSRNQAWNLNLRSRVGESVEYNNSTWVNSTGKNSVPGVGLDWEPVIYAPKADDVTLLIENNIFEFRNNSVSGTAALPEAGDLAVNGIINATITEPKQLARALMYVAGTPQDITSWEVLDSIEIGPEEPELP